ncbi:hypothetical protein GCM10027161_13810 [Microbispora hainanensis]
MLAPYIRLARARPMNAGPADARDGLPALPIAAVSGFRPGQGDRGHEAPHRRPPREPIKITARG